MSLDLESFEKVCNFCRKPRNEVGHLIGAPDDPKDINICDACISEASRLIAEARNGKDAKGLKKPSEIKAFLDEHVIGQEDAKLEVAVAVYEHYLRRKSGTIIQVDGESVEVEKSNILMLGPSGCHRKGQLVLMYDGSLKKVEDVQRGDALMGPDSTSRIVIDLHRGKQEMCEILPTKGEPWVVNADHILSLIRTGYNGGSGYRKVREVVNVSVREWLTWSKTKKSFHKLYRVPVEFSSENRTTLDPYFLGVLLGDGSITARTPRVTTDDPEVLLELEKQADRYGLKVVPYIYNDKCPSYALSGEHGGTPKPNPISDELTSLGLLGVSCEDKFIPQSYLTSDRNSRLQLLAGLLDMDGSLSKNCFDFVNKSQQLGENLVFLARSLGYSAYLKPAVKKSQNGTEGVYYRCCVSGLTHQIPVKIQRKRASTRKQIKNVLHTGFEVRCLPEEDYYGFSVSGDHLYLLGDFTVTHNSGKTHIARGVAKMLGLPFHVHDCTKLTQAGYVGEDVEAILQGLMISASQDPAQAEWGIVFLDEFDKIASRSGHTSTGGRDVTGEGVQQALLKMIEGSVVAVPRGSGNRVSGSAPMDMVNTSNILFIAAGSFAGIESIVDERMNANHGMGFGRESRKKRTKTDIYKNVTVDDIQNFGMIPEIVGRLPVITSTYELSEEDLVRILVEPKNSICKQFRALYKLENVELVFEDDALVKIAQIAKKRSTGARALRSVVKEVLKPYMFNVTEDPDITEIIVTSEAVDEVGKVGKAILNKGEVPASLARSR